jgi:nicotinamidase-related amidase
MAIAVDYQERLIPAMHEKETLMKNSNLLLSGLKMLGIPVIVSRQSPEGLGDTVVELSQAVEGFPVYDKTSFSCYDEKSIKEVIDSYNRKNVIMCGVEAHICVLQTIIDLQAGGFQTIMVSDCVGSRQKRDIKMGMKRAVGEGALPATYESVLFELTRHSKNDRFKAISRLVK